MARVITNAQQLNEFFGNWNRLIVQSTGSDKQLYTLQAVETGWSSTALFVGVLPAGTYQAVELRAINEHVFSSAWRQSSFPPGLRYFEVEGSRFTDLGALVYQPLLLSDTVHEAALLYLEDDHVDASVLALELFPEIAARTERSTSLTWSNNEAHSAARLSPELKQLIHAAAIPNAPPGVGPKQQVLLPARLGQIHARDHSGSWATYDTGYRFALHYVTYSPDIGYIATGESGIILYASQLSGPWTIAPGGIKANGTAFTLIQNTQGDWYQAAVLGKEVSKLDWLNFNHRAQSEIQSVLFTTQNITLGQWQESSLPAERGELQADNKAVFYLDSLRSAFRLSLSDGLWRALGKVPYDHLSELENSDLVSYDVSFRNQTGQMAYRSQNTRWQALNKLFFSGLPQWHNGKLYAIARAPVFIDDSNSIPALDAKLFIRDEQSQQWQSVTTAPAACTLDANLQTLYDTLWLLCTDGSLYRLISNSWSLEWNPALDASVFTSRTSDQRQLLL